MRKLFVFSLLLILVGSCSKHSSSPKGIATWDEVRSLADAFVLEGNVKAILDHTDLNGVPAEEMQKIKPVIENWHGIPKSLKQTDSQVVTFDEYQNLQQEYFKDLPEDMRNALLAGTRWSVKPEKVIVFNFASADPNNTNGSNRFYVGTYQTNGLWYFSANYNE